MLAPLLGLTLPHGNELLIPIIGIACAGVALLLGFIVAGRRRQYSPPVSHKREPVVTRPDPFDYGSAKEKRFSMRRQGHPTKVLLTEDESAGEPEEAWVIDRSTGGLCLQVDHRAIPEGTVLNIRPGGAPPEVPWIPVEVKSCRSKEASWELGCKFLKTPSWSVLLFFG